MEGRYNYERSFIWNVIFYKSVDYARFTRPGETDKIRSVLTTRFFLGMSFGFLVMIAGNVIARSFK